MNVTMPAPAPTAPSSSSATQAPIDRVVGREHSRTSTTSTGRRNDDERTFEEQLDEAAVALAPTPQPKPIDAHAKPRTATGPAAVGATETPATPTTPTTAAVPDSLTSPNAPTAVAAAAPVAAPAAVAADLVITEIDVPAASLATDAAVTANVPASTGDAPTTAATDPATVAAVMTTAVDTASPDDAADAAAPLAPPTSPLDSSPTATPGTPDTGAVLATSPAAFGAMVDAAVDATVDADTAAATEVDVVDVAGDAVADASTPPTLANLTTSARRDDTSAGRVDGLAPAIAEAADDVPAPLRVAPPRTIAVDLNDEGLGPLRVIATSDQRTVHLTVSAGEAVVRDALVRQQADLRHDLADAGLQLGSFEVDARAANRDDADQPAPTGDRPTAEPAGALAVASPVHRTHDADGRLDLRL
ncbi:MAG TPA: flagellar hook-length control protein FliK [Ilumatobacteraceae bacterium]|nr:flagellar hook-length control protein FliK [Ilumatobacteraceae bacterium]